jgi:hypothetical protein
MRPLGSVLLFLVTLSASADCMPRTLLRASGPIHKAHVDHGALYYSTFNQQTIQRVDEATGQTSTVFTADRPLDGWDIENGTIALLQSATELLLVAPDGSRRVIDTPSVIRRFNLQDGYVYWLEQNDILYRARSSGGAVETVAVGVSMDYVIFEDRLVFTASNGVVWQPLGGGMQVLLLPRSDVAISAVTRDGVIVSTSSSFDPNVSHAALLRVPWTGAPVETIYESSVTGYVPYEALSAVVRGATTYIIRTVTIHFFSTTSTVIVLRNGVARERAVTAIKPYTVLAADEDSITVGRWIDAGGMRQIERLCADAPRTRAVR